MGFWAPTRHTHTQAHTPGKPGKQSPVTLQTPRSSRDARLFLRPPGTRQVLLSPGTAVCHFPSALLLLAIGSRLSPSNHRLFSYSQ
jgi:hypothetical protein